jgi:hypothetical protein
VTSRVGERRFTDRFKRQTKGLDSGTQHSRVDTNTKKPSTGIYS